MTWRVIIMAGGTGGHIYPAMAVAECLEEMGCIVHWLGAERGMETELVDTERFPLHTLATTAIRGGGLQRKLLAPLNLVKAVLQATKIIRQVQPDILIGFGGYASGPGAVAGKIKGCPIFIHEQNAVPGLTNKWVAKWATKVIQAFPNTFADDLKPITLGNPVRQSLVNASENENTGSSLKVLVMGGSSGAQILNEKMPEVLSVIPEEHRPEVRHQAGKGKLAATQWAYDQVNLAATAEEYIDDMASALAWADLVICRSGASTISELAAAGQPAILVPYPWHKDRQQFHNAQVLAKKGGAWIVEQEKAGDNTQLVKAIAAHITRLTKQPSELQKVSARALAQAVPDSAKRVALLAHKYLTQQAGNLNHDTSTKTH